MKLIVGLAIILGIRSGRLESDGKVVEAAQRIVVAPLNRTGDLDSGDLSRQGREQHFAFEAGDELADTHVDTGPEADVAAGPTRNVIRVGIVPPSRIAVGCCEKHENFLTLADPVSADVDIPCPGAEKGLHRAFETDRFLDAVPAQPGLLPHPPPLSRNAPQTHDPPP